MDLLSATLTLILIMDPLGNIPMFLSILNKIPDENRRRKILIRELLLALLVLLIFLFLGRHLLQWLNLQPQSLRIGGGIVLFLNEKKLSFLLLHEASWDNSRKENPYLSRLPSLFLLARPLWQC